MSTSPSSTSTSSPKYLPNRQPRGEHKLLPLCFWAAQTTAAAIGLHLRPLSSQCLITPTAAARTIQQCFKSYKRRLVIGTCLQQQQQFAATTIQRYCRGFTVHQRILCLRLQSIWCQLNQQSASRIIQRSFLRYLLWKQLRPDCLKLRDLAQAYEQMQPLPYAKHKQLSGVLLTTLNFG